MINIEYIRFLRRRDMSISTLFKESLAIARGNPFIFIPMLAASIFSALMGLIFIGPAVPMSHGMSFDSMAINPEPALAGEILLFGILSGFIGLLTHSMAVGMADMAFHGEKAGLKKGWTRIVSRIVPIVIASVLMGIVITLGTLFLVLPGIILAFFLMFTLIAVVVNNLGAFKAIGRSFTMVGKNFTATFITFLSIIGLAILTGLLSAILRLIPYAGGILTLIIFALFSGFVTIFLVRLYNEIELSDGASPEVDA